MGSDPAAGSAGASATVGGANVGGNAGATVGSGGANAGSANAGSANGGVSGANTSAGSANAGQAGAPPIISGQPAAGSVFVHLFEWKWTDIATECESYLGPSGFAGVQVSPPSEHALIATYPWYQRYQTVSYSLAQSRSGTAAEFADMVQRCARVGVGIYVDAVTVGQFRTADPATGNLLPSAQAVVFTTNHDTERADAIYYKDGAPYDLATVFLLAWPYGYPSLMSSFAFDRATSAGMALGPPSDTMGHTDSIYAPGSKAPNCAADPHNPAAGTWVCQHRDAFVAPMLAFRKATVGAETITNFWDNGKDQVAFGRGAKGFVVINDEDTALSRAFATGLPAGSYCDVIAGGLKAGACAGAAVVVDSAGIATIAAPARTAVVIRVGQTK